jgi:signal transduction histidine kinase/phage shock protein PspC (stress-responsive transcriptional regulator)
METHTGVCDHPRMERLPPRQLPRQPPPQPSRQPPPPQRVPAAVPKRRPGTLGFARSSEARLIAGVGGGLGRRLGVDPMLIRIAFAVLAFAGGTGIVLYGVLWALAPLDTDLDRPLPPRRPATLQQGAALGLILLGVLIFLRGVGLWFGDALAWPVTLAAAGSAIVWVRGDDDQRAAWSRAASRIPGGHALASAASAPVSPTRVAVGTLFVILSVIGFLVASESVVAVRDLALAIAAAVVGIALLFGPWLWRLADQLGEERRERIRQEERAELAAHLHDSVLQTLTMIQRSSDQPRRMVALARSQERELRSWLYGAAAEPGATATLTDAVESVAEEVEAIHDVAVEVVVVGDAPVDDHVRALLAATREACVNAAKHAGVTTVDVFVEVEPDTVSAFVRDRGRGFDPDDVPADRQGIRRSIVDRLERHSGSSLIHSRPGEGTEVELCVPRPRRWAGESGPRHAQPLEESS